MIRITIGDAILVAKGNEIFHNSKKVQKFSENILYFTTVHSEKFLDDGKIENMRFLACDSTTLKLFTIEQTLLTHKSSSKITDITYSTSKSFFIYFSTLKGLFQIEYSTKEILTLSNKSVTSICFLDIKNNKNVSQFFGLSNDFSENCNLLYSDNKNLYFRSNEMPLANIKKFVTTDQNIFIILENGYIHIWKFHTELKNFRFVSIPNVKNFVELTDQITKKKRVFAMTTNRIFSTDFTSTETAPIKYLENDIIYTENGTYKLVLKNKLLFLNEITENFRWIFEPALRKLDEPLPEPPKTAIQKEKEIEKKSIWYKEPEHSYHSFHTKYRKPHVFYNLRRLIAKNLYVLFLKKIEEIERVEKLQIQRLFQKIIFKNEPVITKKYLFNKIKGDLLLKNLSDKEFVESLILYQIKKTKFIMKRLKKIFKQKKMLIETGCLIDMVLFSQNTP
ncbi:hypothetical protein M153_11090001347 [Pseudoloma neurophilia]|uniref:Uncharacterized protein n=1 Tax=Pseudoloma neurophilia TaxID=146866 RepID=A0A0R0LZJ5_9MICR|nr:hypothetical protein M153_11090001347 [Pseudoloma neurophilia]